MNALSLLVAVFSAIPALAAGVHFPSAASSQSPDGKWKLICQKPRNREEMPVLVLENIRGKRFELRRFDHDCVALWSTDSARIAITDWLTSDRADVFIHAVAHPRTSRSVSRLFPRTAIPEEERNGHCYFEAVEWLDSHRLRIRVSGHRDVAPATNFAYEFIFDVKSSRFEKTKDRRAEPTGPANGSRPIRSETNRTSPAAGSRR